MEDQSGIIKHLINPKEGKKGEENIKQSRSNRKQKDGSYNPHVSIITLIVLGLLTPIEIIRLPF